MAASSESIAAVSQPPEESVLDRARRKAYYRLLPLCFLCYVIAYVDRANVSLAKLTMARDLPGFDDAVIGFGAGCSSSATSCWRSPARSWSRSGARGSGSAGS